jgi:dimethylargininase
MPTRRALVRRPSPRLAQGIVTHIERRPVDSEKALDQWNGYVGALQRHDWATIEVPAAPDCPDSAFVEDTVVMAGEVAVVCRPGDETRTPETVAVERTVSDLGFEVRSITGAGSLDGGDVLKVRDTWYVGRGGRTNPEGVRQLRAILAPLGVSVVAVPISKVLHLKSAVTALPDGSIIGYPPLVDDPDFFPHFVAVPEESGSHIVDLGEGRLLMAAGAERTAALLEDRGYQPVLVDISEYEKLEGCVTCLSVRLRGTT